MNVSDRWKEISALYAAALERPEADRAAFVREACGDDVMLREQLESLLACHDEAQRSLTSPAVHVLAQAMAAEAASLLGRFLGAYRIDARLGSGGMGEVYRATDTRLHRQVAVKILPPHVRTDAALRQRLEREAQAIASLRHPHICVLHDIGHADGIDFLVMELLEGETLAERLRRGPLSCEEALRYGLEIAEALIAIHRHGLVHRDLKPGNVMLTESGAKLLDFGLAKVQGATSTGAVEGPSHSVSALAVGTTTAAGTLPYMTPEQLDRGDIDHRSDLFAFGSVLYEMVTGRKAFDGDGRDELAAAIRTRQPQSLPESLEASAPGLQHVIDRCLRKNPAGRWQDATALRSALQEVRDAARRRWSAPRLAGALVALVLITGLVTSIAWSLKGPSTPAAPPPLVLDSTQPVAATEQFEMDPAWSPRGNVIAYASGRGTEFRIIVRDLTTGLTLPGPPAAAVAQLQPRWSADGNRLLYITREGVFVWTVGEAASRRIAAPSEVAGSYSVAIGLAVITGAAWSPDGREIAVAWGGALYAVSVDTGRRRHLVTTPEELHWCDWSPGGTWIACTGGNTHLPFYGANLGNVAPSAVVVIPAAGGRAIEIAPKTSSNQSPVWSADERLLYFISNRQGPGDIYAVEIADTGAPAGDPVRITTGLNASAIALAADRKKLAYSGLVARANVWSLPIPPPGSRADPAAARQVTFGNQRIEAMHVTPDRKWLLYDSDISGNSEIYRMPLGGGEPERLTDNPAGDFGPEVSPGGRWLAYFSWRTKSRDVFVQPFDGGTVEQVTSTAGQESYPTWLSDDSILFVDQAMENGLLRGLFVVRRGQDGKWTKPEPLVSGAFRGAIRRDGAIVYNKGGALYMRRPEGGEPVLLYERPDDRHPMSGPLVALDDDERWIYTKNFDSTGRAVFYALPMSGGSLTDIVRFEDLARPSTRIELAVGGGQLFFTIDDRRSNIWVADIAER